MSVFIGQQPVVLRLPEGKAEAVHRHIVEGNFVLQAEVQPESTEEQAKSMALHDPRKDFFRFKYGGEELPALLANLATKIETHKVVDGYKLYKASDVGQMLQVFESEEERQLMADSLSDYSELGFNCLPSGLTPPMHKVIERKWSRQFKENGPVRKAAVQQVCKEVLAGPSTAAAYQGEMTREVYEEVVPFEEWMVASGSYRAGVFEPVGATFMLSDGNWAASTEGFMDHPHILETCRGNDDEWIFLHSDVEAEEAAVAAAAAEIAEGRREGIPMDVIQATLPSPPQLSAGAFVPASGLGENMRSRLGADSAPSGRADLGPPLSVNSFDTSIIEQEPSHQIVPETENQESLFGSDDSDGDSGGGGSDNDGDGDGGAEATDVLATAAATAAADGNQMEEELAELFGSDGEEDD